MLQQLKILAVTKIDVVIVWACVSDSRETCLFVLLKSVLHDFNN